MTFETYIINLDKRKERLQLAEENLRDYGFGAIKKFSAVEDEIGEIGCAKSHFHLLSHILTKTSNNFSLILEDDFRFSIKNSEIEEILINMEKEQIHFDVLQMFVLNPILVRFLIH